MTYDRSTSESERKFDRGFWNLILDNLNPIYGLPLGIAGILVSLFPDYFKDNNIIAIIIIISLIACGTFLKTTLAVYKDNKYLRNKGTALPKIIEGRKSYREYDKGKALCILEPSEFFGYGFFCSIYHCDGNFEQPIGYGEVINIQNDKFIQVEITRVLKGHEDKIDLIIQNNHRCLENIRIKPSISSRYFEQISNEEDAYVRRQ
jgi:hypothetical protein